MKKRILSILLVLVLLSTSLPMASAAGLHYFTTSKTYSAFEDVPADAWYAPNVKLAYELGLVKGVSKTRFNPTGNVTLAETVALACRIHSIYNGNGSSFQQGDPWYVVYVDYAVANGILTTEYSDYTKAATRAQFASILANALPASALSAINNIPAGKIPDVTGSEAYGTAVYTLYNAGILTGSDKYGTFYPENAIVRSEVSAIITRMADTDLRKTVTLKDKPVTPQEKPAAPQEKPVTILGALPSYDVLHQFVKDCTPALEDLLYASEILLGAGDFSENPQVYQPAILRAQQYIGTCIEKLTALQKTAASYTEMSLLSTTLQQIIATLQPATTVSTNGYFWPVSRPINDAIATANSMFKNIVTPELYRLILKVAG